jgi:peptide/nickel transport system permease protein
MLEVLGSEYITAARARGLMERRIVFGHALKNAFFPVLTLIGLSLGHLLGGTVVIETIFGLPGLGKLVVDAIQQRDYPMIQGAALVLSVNVVLVNLKVDLMYGWLNPRIRYE